MSQFGFSQLFIIIRKVYRQVFLNFFSMKFNYGEFDADVKILKGKNQFAFKPIEHC